jgi:hypothetical protein
MNDNNSNNAGLGLGIAGLVLGILSVPLGLMKCTFITGIVFGGLGITLSAIGLTQAKKAGSATGLILAALILSIVGMIFALISMSNTISKSKDHFINLKTKIEKIEKIDNNSDEFEDAFKEGFESEYGKDMEKTLKDLEKEFDKSPINIDQEIDKAMQNLTDEEKARKTGRAFGRALKSFVDEINDSTAKE